MRFNNLPIAKKLAWLLGLNTLVAVVAIASVFTIGTSISRYNEIEEQVHSLAGMVGENSRAALAFSDPESAARTLMALRSKEEVSHARLNNAHGEEFAAVSFPLEEDEDHPLVRALLTYMAADSFKVSQPILDGDTLMGTVELTVRMSSVWAELLEGLQWMSLLAAVLSILAVYLGTKLHRFVTYPILGLAEVSHRVSSEQDYSLRAKKMGNDEIGALVDDFNRMLAEIQVRDEALRRERASLGDRVKQRTADLTEAMEEAKLANKVKSEFLSTVSHELRTPLTAIAGSIGLIAGGALGPLPESIREMLQIADKNSQRLTFLINDLLDMEKLMAGKLHFDFQAQALMPLLERALTDNQSYAARFGVRYVMQQRIDGVQVNVDGQRLQQVLANLLSNAAKFSHDGGEVGIYVECTPRGIRVDVIDQGSGIPIELHSRVFQKFFQADASDTRQKGGTGLGLAITRELVEHMGGQVGFESTEGVGSRFFFELPIWQPESPLVRLAPNQALEAPQPRVLVVEDDHEVSRVLSLMLRRAGYAVDVVATGGEALMHAVQGGYAAMTLDLLLPDIQGIEIIQRLRAQPATEQLPIVVIAANMQESRRAAPSGLKGVDWLSKPIDQHQLIAVLRNACKARPKKRTRVLHVEDDANMHEVVKSLMGDLCEFEFATTIREAQARVALERFDVVLLDLTMPAASGWDLLPSIRAQQPGARVVVLSVSQLDSDASARVDAVLHKSRLTSRALHEALLGHPVSGFGSTEPQALETKP